jgi:hypothetical protein
MNHPIESDRIRSHSVKLADLPRIPTPTIKTTNQTTADIRHNGPHPPIPQNPMLLPVLPGKSPSVNPRIESSNLLHPCGPTRRSCVNRSVLETVPTFSSAYPASCCALFFVKHPNITGLVYVVGTSLQPVATPLRRNSSHRADVHGHVSPKKHIATPFQTRSPIVNCLLSPTAPRVFPHALQALATLSNPFNPPLTIPLPPRTTRYLLSSLGLLDSRGRWRGFAVERYHPPVDARDPVVPQRDVDTSTSRNDRNAMDFTAPSIPLPLIDPLGIARYAFEIADEAMWLADDAARHPQQRTTREVDGIGRGGGAGGGVSSAGNPPRWAVVWGSGLISCRPTVLRPCSPWLALP